jgi:hypothetical protein
MSPKGAALTATGEQHDDGHHPLALVGLAVTGILTGALLGALTNSVNGRVSPLYFRNIMGWHDVEDVWRASVAQGVFEGLLFGLFLALVFTIVVGCVSKARWPCRFGVAVLLFVAVAARLDSLPTALRILVRMRRMLLE